MTRQAEPLDAFETRLLKELKSIVNTQPAEADQVPVRPAWKRRSWLVPVAAVAASAAVVGGISFARPTPAFAVTGSNGQRITVTVNRLQGAGALEAALHRRGVHAQVQYLPAGKRCQAGRYTDIPTPGMTLEVGSTSFKIVIPPDAVKQADTFVLSAAVKTYHDGVQAIVDFGITGGRIAPCSITDAG